MHFCQLTALLECPVTTLSIGSRQISVVLINGFSYQRLHLSTASLINALLVSRLLWLVLVSTCAGVMGYQIIDRIVYFYHYPVTVNVKVNFNKTLHFPSLTLCNQNTFR